MQTPIDDISSIELRKSELKKRIDRSAQRMSDLFDELKAEKEPNSRAEHITQVISKTISLADSAYFGWKMYKRFGHLLSFGKRRKR